MRKGTKIDKNGKITDMAKISLCSVFIAVCSWIAVPGAVPFTLQTFGVFFVLLILGGKRATVSLIIYLCIGALGVPVFSHFKGGIGVLFGATGGFLIGFVVMSLLYWLITSFFGKSGFVKISALLIGDAVCFAFGTVWYITVFLNGFSSGNIRAALTLCVVPFIIPDVLKLILAYTVAKKCSSVIKV